MADEHYKTIRNTMSKRGFERKALQNKSEE
jgi:hypothetical protein